MVDSIAPVYAPTVVAAECGVFEGLEGSIVKAVVEEGLG